MEFIGIAKEMSAPMLVGKALVSMMISIHQTCSLQLHSQQGISKDALATKQNRFANKIK